MAVDDRRVIPPGGTIGILGGGQLGRMTALAAARLGYRCHIYCPETDSPAAQVSAAATVAPYDDIAALTRFAESVDVATFEFENIPAGAVRAVSAVVPVRPGVKALETSQDRIAEKRFFEREGIATASWRPVHDFPALGPALAQIGVPALLKTTRQGYDGKGQARIMAEADAMAAWRAVGSKPSILEGLVKFEREISAVVARGVDGQVDCYDVVENVHLGGILHTTTAPAPIAPDLADEARAMAKRAADALELVGLLALEMFVTRDGALLANEMAPRPHNSGHWTMDAAATSQFEQLVRAVCGLPLGDPTRFADAVMTNLIGDEIEQWPEFLKEPGARLHLYGKAEARPGRKMGHVTRVSNRRA
jgi:5-(carboxyamino)imidazole ribonucleotide synthase